MDTQNETDLELSTTDTNKRDPFKKPKKPIQKTFNVVSDETLSDSDVEKSMTCSKSLFKKKNKPADDLFCVSFNETNANVTENDTLVRSIIGTHDGLRSIMNKSNPFKQKKLGSAAPLEKQNSIQVIASEDTEKSIGNLEKSGKNFTLDKSSDIEDLELTYYITKPNPFIKKSKSLKEQSMQVSVMEEEEKSMGNFTLGGSLDFEDVEPTKYIKKINPFKKSKSHEVHSMQVSVSEEDSTVNNFSVDKSTDGGDGKLKNLFRRSNKSKNGSFKEKELQVSVEDDLGDGGKINDNDDEGSDDENNDYYGSHDAVHDKEEENEMEKSMGRKLDVSRKMEKVQKSLHIDKSLTVQSNLSSISEIYVNQSSFNDENLNIELSDYSDEDMPLSSIPPVRLNPTLTNEKSQEEKVSSTTDAGPKMSWEEKFNEIVSKSKKGSHTQVEKKPKPAKITTKQKEKPLEYYRPMRLKKPAPFANKRLYRHIINKLEPKYGIDTIVEAEQIVCTICETVKKVTKRKNHQKKLIQDLKKELASVGLIETTMDFYEFVIGFLPYPFRVKVVPCLQTRTNSVFPPKDVGNPFDKI